jgi:asparagine synthase (glutamine-hydrolysing)
MGAVLAILGEAGDPELGERLQRMLARSPYRGEPEFLVEGPLAIGIQSLGLDASLAEVGNWLVAFHGYIGNWAELAAERGWRFEDDVSNAYKIAVAFEELGDRLFGRLRGEWALLIWDRRERALLAARDVVGCRPLFAHRYGKRLFLATEIRQAMAGSGTEARCDPGAAADYHLVRFPEAGRTVFEGVRRLPGGVARSFRAPAEELTFIDVEFWNPPPVDRGGTDHRELAEEVRGLIDAAVRRTAPETGAAVSLSGGMDSSSVWATLALQAGPDGLQSGKFKPYSNVYPGLPCDETPYIRSILEFTGVEGDLIDTSAVLASDYLESLCKRLDNPHLPNALPVELVCQSAASNGHDTLLTGSGGDEWLGGSLDYVRELFYSGRMITALLDLSRIRLPARLGGFRRKISLLSPQVGLAARFGFRVATRRAGPSVVSAEHRAAHAAIRGSWWERIRGDELSASRARLVRSMDRLVATCVLEIIEQQAARHGVEVRHPLMDLDIVEFGFAVEPRALIAGRCHKWLLRRAMVGRLPAEVLGRVETTEFNCIFIREESLLKRFSPAREWHLARLGVTDADAIDSRITGAYSRNATFEMIRLVWLESFIRGNFQTGRRGGCGENV